MQQAKDFALHLDELDGGMRGDLWRGSLLPLGRRAPPKRVARQTPSAGFAPASQASGSKLPRHGFCV
ncbi:hypothetical protein C1X99_22645 [Pseudomonas sp. FW306-02-H06B]|nr:hypothetical protein C1X99_22645 [Pseudomonas sp. FW306-02-H06B]PMZ45662.1 hypothetical protein C1Y03_16520 [Pseudomonas sp. FW306-02-H05-AA]PMZ94945.1 hypothetical protein C1X95_19885 [Pseudomonas sp. FW306-2-11AD]PNB08269.1 hypothetical protein C1Y01_16955 [Pseudomonas sp. FW306-02-H05-BA]